MKSLSSSNMVHLIRSENGAPVRRGAYLKTVCGFWINPKEILTDAAPCTCNKCIRLDAAYTSADLVPEGY